MEESVCVSHKTVVNIIGIRLEYDRSEEHLEYAAQAWHRNLIGDIEKLKLVQKRALKIPEGFVDLDCRDRLRQLNLTSLKDSRTRGDLIEMFKVQKVFEKIALLKSPLLIKHTGPAAGVRGNSLRLHIESNKARLDRVTISLNP